MAFTKELGVSQQLHEWFGEEEADRQVKQGGQAEGEGETLHPTNGEDE